MTWIAVNKNASGEQHADAQVSVAQATFELLPQGSITINFDFSQGQKAPCRLLDYQLFDGWQRRFTIYLNADYSISLEVQQGGSQTYLKLANIDLREANELRLTYAWNAPEKVGILTLENEVDGTIHQAATPAPIPLPLSDAKAIIAGNENAAFDDRVHSLALSDNMVPFGPDPTIAAGALVETADGPRPIERLNIGDWVQTKDNGLQSVRWIIHRELPAMGPTAPIRLRAPYFGLHNDITVTRNQRILFTDTDAEFGLSQDAAFIQAGNLVGYHAAQSVAPAISTDFYQVLLDNHECISVSGSWLDSLYVGYIKRAPRIVAASTLSDVPPAILPLHQKLSHPLLHGYERRALLDTLIA